MKVLTRETTWQAFLRRARRRVHQKVEYMEALWGTEIDDSVLITEFHPLHGNWTSDRTTLEYDGMEVARQRVLAHRKGLTYLGTIHTHDPEDMDIAGSEDDHYSSVLAGDKVFGIVLIRKNGRRYSYDARWWRPQQPIPFEFLPEQEEEKIDAKTASIQPAPPREEPAQGKEAVQGHGTG